MHTLEHVAAPPAFRIPTDMRASLAAARAEGLAQAQSWSASHAGAPLDSLLEDLFTGIPAAPTGEALQAELARSVNANTHASAATIATGEWYGTYGQAGIKRPNLWRDLLTQWQHREIEQRGPVEGARRAAEGAQLVLDAITQSNVVVWRSKPLAREARPYVLDPRTKVPKGGWEDADYESHPSGHASTAAAAATVLGALWPERRAEFDMLADRISWSRVLGEMHFPHDVVSGTRIGVATAEALILRNPTFGAQLLTPATRAA
ncbi:MAG: phosphoesterase, PA-phosphatase related [Thermoleophilia bacterium]|nr:phosphoesterase, PA-phosphatase related [Thermoleophilia bacterium]